MSRWVSSRGSFAIIVKGFKPLTIVAKLSILIPSEHFWGIKKWRVVIRTWFSFLYRLFKGVWKGRGSKPSSRKQLHLRYHKRCYYLSINWRKAFFFIPLFCGTNTSLKPFAVFMESFKVLKRHRNNFYVFFFRWDCWMCMESVYLRFHLRCITPLSYAYRAKYIQLMYVDLYWGLLKVIGLWF